MKLADNIAGFVRVLRKAGLPLGPASTLDALRAAEAVDVLRREQFYWALHAVLVRRPADHEVYDQAFGLFWRDPFATEPSLSMLLSQSRVPAPSRVSRRVAEALAPSATRPLPKPGQRAELDAALLYAPDEALRTKRFEDMGADELRRAKALVSAMRLVVRPVRTRRTEPAGRGPRIDLARSFRDSLRSGGDMAPLRFRRRTLRPPPLVALCDISGSMGRYSEMLLVFLHALVSHRPRVHTFVFATRLSNITPLLRTRDVDVALARCGREVQDWASGTRLSACFREFNRAWSRRVLAQGAVVLLISDELDRDPEPGLAHEAERLRKSCRRLIWLNPLLSFSQFEPRAQGIRALLPHVDEHRPVHDLASLESLAEALGRPFRRRPA